MNKPERKLTPRQEQLLSLVCDFPPRTTKQLASQMRVSEGTVKVYLSEIFAKFGLHRSGNPRERLRTMLLEERIENLELVIAGLRSRVASHANAGPIKT